MPESDLIDHIEDNSGANVLGLPLHLIHQPWTLDDFGETWVILDIRRDGHLPARLETGHKQRLQIGACCIDRCGVTGGPCADDQDLAVVTLRHNAILVDLTETIAFLRRREKERA
jgi:hypothetical protein